MVGSERISRHRANLFRAILAHVPDPNKLLIQRIAVMLALLLCRSDLPD
jgi:hypothetical protein